MDDNVKRLHAVQGELGQKEQDGKAHEPALTFEQVTTLKQSFSRAFSPTERREWIETEQLALRQDYNRRYDTGLHGKIPEEILQRREKLRLVALGEGLRALRAIQAAGGQAVLFGSVLSPFGFQEGSDIDICLVEPPDFASGLQFMTIAENAVVGFAVDMSWLNDLQPRIREKVLVEGLGLTEVSELPERELAEIMNQDPKDKQSKKKRIDMQEDEKATVALFSRLLEGVRGGQLQEHWVGHEQEDAITHMQAMIDIVSKCVQELEALDPTSKTPDRKKV